ncbi:hypothetical protein NE237_012713 [Protea cynaroides]|uniref:B3 domain-containing protein n=1 Tax=Protea cynaroides TaxID=273540 RepID=A0A9Q0H0M8_9MAGN|nr:hypothetical protein NE237_012713 [Protea cynaroides]
MAVIRKQRVRREGVRREPRETRETRENRQLLELNLYRDPWTIKKKLMESDVNNLSRLILPTQLVDNHVLRYFSDEERFAVLHSERGLELKMKDLDQGTCHLLTLKKLGSSGSFKLGLNWISEFVKRRRLQKGDVIGMFWDNYSTRDNNYDTRGFCFSVLERYAPNSDANAEAVVAATPPNPSLCKFAREDLHLHPPVSEP